MNMLYTVGISDMAAVKSPDTLVTYALGSCVGICLYDEYAHIAGLSHIMLPNSRLSNIPGQIGKFADTAPILLIQKMAQLGANPNFLKAKIAGGAKMFTLPDSTAVGNIGQRNVEAVKTALAALRIPIVAEDTGLNYGRTVYFDADTFTMRIKSTTHGEKCL